MTVPTFDELSFGVARPSLRIAPLQDPFPTLSSSSTRPSPLEPNARVNINDDANKLTGRRKALAQAKPLDAPDGEDWDLFAISKSNADLPAGDAEHLLEPPQKKHRLRSCDQEQIADFVQLPKPPAKAGQHRPRPFRPVSVLNELHEPPPSAALFPPITPAASQEEDGERVTEKQVSKANDEKRPGHARRKKSSERSMSPGAQKRTYNRGRTKWTQDEIDFLIKGVTIYGTGRWKNILDHPDLHFREGRTPTDLKDRFRVCFPPNTNSRSVKPDFKKTETVDEDFTTPLRITAEEMSRKPERPIQRARKRHWTESEDAELEKGFRRHGYNWNAMVKDPDLHFDGRSGGQIRDRFRLKFKDLYEGQDVTHVPNKAAERADPQRKRQSEQRQTLTEKMKDPSTQAGDGEGDAENHCKMTSKTPFSCVLLNAEEEDSRLSNSILHNALEWDDNLTLAPLTWEDMATRPIFTFD